MPELPEVETVCIGLAQALIGRGIIGVEVRRKGLRVPFPVDLTQRITGGVVTAIHRRAKYILIALDNGQTIILHLGMSGRLTTEVMCDSQPLQYGKHDHLIVQFTGSPALLLRFNDPRRFGLCEVTSTSNLDQHKLLKPLGIEPLSDEFTAEYLHKILKGKGTSIKLALLDQHIVAGIGNIYACEALFYAGISPLRHAGDCTYIMLERLVTTIRQVLLAAIAAGGSSMRDYVRVDGSAGAFQDQVAVYDQAGKPCPSCTCDLAKTEGIQRVVQGGRSTFWCKIKQV